MINLCFFDLFGSREHVNLVQIEKSSKLPQDLRQIVEYAAGNGSHTFEKNTFNTSVEN